MELAKGMHILSDDDLSQICGGVDIDIDETVQFLVGLIVGPIAGFLVPVLPLFDTGRFEDFNKGILFSSVPTDLLMVYLSYRGLKAIFSKSSPSCNSKDDKKVETDETKLKEQSACA